MSKRAAGESVTIDDGKKPNLGSVDVDAIDASNSNALDNDDCIILPPTEASVILIESDPEDENDNSDRSSTTSVQATATPHSATTTVVSSALSAAPADTFKYTTCSCLKPNCIFCIPEKTRKMLFRIYNGYPLIDPPRTIYATIAAYTKVPEVHVTRTFNLYNRSLNRTSKKKPFGETAEAAQFKPLTPLEVAFARRQLLDANIHQQRNAFLQIWRTFRRKSTPADFLTTIIDSGSIHYRRIKHRITKRENFVLLEANKLRAARSHFIEAIRKFRADGRRIVYVHQLNPLDASENTMIFLAVSVDGPIATTYLKHATTKTFVKWLHQHVINRMTKPIPAVFVLTDPDVFRSDAPTVPTSTDTKATMIKWLKNENIPFDKDLFKIELYDLIERTVRARSTDTARQHEIELKQMGHEVLYIPKTNCDLNPLEYILMHIKLKTLANGGSFDLDAELHGMQRERRIECFQRILAYENEYVAIEEKIKTLKKNYHIDKCGDVDRKEYDLLSKCTIDVSICTPQG